MKTKVENFERQELFDMYDSRTNPFSIITTRIDITNIYELCKTKKNIYGTIGYYFTKAMNKIDAFKYVKLDGEIYKYDILNLNYVELLDDGNIGFFTSKFYDDYEEYLENYIKTKNEFMKTKQYNGNEEDGEVWLSCEPWFNFSGIIPPFDKNISTPQLIWDKFIFDNEHVYVNLMIMAHHGFVDGSHIGALINNINEEISKIKSE